MCYDEVLHKFTLYLLTPNPHQQQTNSQFFLQAGCPPCCPMNSVRENSSADSNDVKILIVMMANKSWKSSLCGIWIKQLLICYPTDGRWPSYSDHTVLKVACSVGSRVSSLPWLKVFLPEKWKNLAKASKNHGFYQYCEVTNSNWQWHRGNFPQRPHRANKTWSSYFTVKNKMNRQI